MKLCFSVSTKPKIHRNLATADDQSTGQAVEFVTEFDSTKTLNPNNNNNNPIKPKIRPLQNVYNPYKKKMKTTNLDQQSEFELEETRAPISQDDDNISYGLNIRVSGNSDTTKVSVDAGMLQKLKQDLRDLPDDPGMDEYNEMPVEGFGAALLAGYGWKEGMGIGRNAKEDVKVVQYHRKTAKEGLGFISDMPSVTEKEENVKVKINDIADLGSMEEDKCLRKLKELKNRGSKDDRPRRERKRDRDQGRRSELKEESRAMSQVCWLTSHIRVRVISKNLKGGRLYLKKGKIVDVVGPTTCDICMDESRELVQGVDQDLLETALPRRGGPVLVLYGKHKGVYGSLVEKDSEREKGVIRDADTHAMLNVPLEQIAEYAGDPDLIGY